MRFLTISTVSTSSEGKDQKVRRTIRLEAINVINHDELLLTMSDGCEFKLADESQIHKINDFIVVE